MPKTKDLLKFYLLSFTWGLLTTLVGLIVFTLLWIFFHAKLKVRVIAGRIAVTITNKTFGGLSLGLFYFVDRYDFGHTHLHELGHTIQNMYFGPFFFILIGIPSVARYHYRKYLRKKGVLKTRYDDVWFEGQATKLGYKYFNDYINTKL
jgi:hypothetical protein